MVKIGFGCVYKLGFFFEFQVIYGACKIQNMV